MPSNRTSSPARLLAPVALVVFALAVALVVLGSGDSGGGAGTGTTADRQTTTPERAAQRRRRPTTYTVKPGDTLGGIGEKTGTDADILQELNPSLDPRALTAGQKIKLPPK